MNKELELIKRKIKILETYIKSIKLMKKDFDRVISKTLNNSQKQDIELNTTNYCYKIEPKHTYKSRSTLLNTFIFNPDNIDYARDLIKIGLAANNISNLDKKLCKLRKELKSLVIKRDAIRFKNFEKGVENE
jgi:hypothetical protein